MTLALVAFLPSKFGIVTAMSEYSLSACLPKFLTINQPRNASVTATISSLTPALTCQNTSKEDHIIGRCFGDISLGSRNDIKDRVMMVLKRNHKFDIEKFSSSSNFFQDVGMDSVEHLELVMGLEDEFGLEIPDNHGDRLLTPDMMVIYLRDLLESQNVK
jgi:acyl carrier protein